MNCGENGKKGISCAHQALFFAEKRVITETKVKLDKYYGDSAPSILMVKKWFTEFRCERISTIDAERSGCPLEYMYVYIYPKQLKKFAIWCWPIED